MIRIDNDGQNVVSTNFFESDMARDGTFFISTNAGCFRVLVPAGLDSYVMDMATGFRCEIERVTLQGQDGLRVWFLDGSDSPFRIESTSEAIDRFPADQDTGRDALTVAIYLSGPRKVLELPATYLGRCA